MQTRWDETNEGVSYYNRRASAVINSRKKGTNKMATVSASNETRSLSTIAREIRADWKNVYFGAKPYLDAMASLDKVSDSYGFDDGKSIVLYFLANASTWRGEKAKAIKAELKKMVGSK